ncbi:hypothetical protein G7Y89_g12815 [Cudoniella acicularis]|uniref:Uncharacterized protein n=1 Tax=Cudoniella acicularis TaxID=354080 RepID=A0A8H4R8H4_9HELO|nr:hypothetical protein G7Y89_g12815 [Cudoniella acicularis]
MQFVYDVPPLRSVVDVVSHFVLNQEIVFLYTDAIDGGSESDQGSQAYSQNVPSEESISPNSSSVGFSRTMVDLYGISASSGLQLKLSYTPGVQGSFGAPQNWGLEIPFTISGKSLTLRGKTFVVDLNWSDQTNHQYGLRYVNHHGMLFKSYFDAYGKLLEHADLYGNSIYFAYVDPMAGPMTAKVDYILDSWG